MNKMRMFFVFKTMNTSTNHPSRIFVDFICFFPLLFLFFFAGISSSSYFLSELIDEVFNSSFHTLKIVNILYVTCSIFTASLNKQSPSLFLYTCIAPLEFMGSYSSILTVSKLTKWLRQYPLMTSNALNSIRNFPPPMLLFPNNEFSLPSMRWNSLEG